MEIMQLCKSSFCACETYQVIIIISSDNYRLENAKKKVNKAWDLFAFSFFSSIINWEKFIKTGTQRFDSQSMQLLARETKYGSNVFVIKSFQRNNAYSYYAMIYATDFGYYPLQKDR